MWRRILIVFVVVLLAFIGVGFLLPRHIVIARTRIIPAPVDRVYPHVADFKAWEQWAAWQQRDPEMQHQYEGTPGTAGSVYRWQSKKEGDGVMVHEYVSVNDSILSKLVIGGWESYSGFGLRAASAVQEGQAGSEPGTRVLWAMHADMGNNPLSRWMGLMLDNYIARDYDQGLQGLEEVVMRGATAQAKP